MSGFPSTDEVKNHKLPELKKLCKDYGLTQTGKKEELVDKILEYIQKCNEDKLLGMDTTPTKQTVKITMKSATTAPAIITAATTPATVKQQQTPVTVKQPGGVGPGVNVIKVQQQPTLKPSAPAVTTGQSAAATKVVLNKPQATPTAVATTMKIGSANATAGTTKPTAAATTAAVTKVVKLAAAAASPEIPAVLERHDKPLSEMTVEERKAIRAQRFAIAGEPSKAELDAKKEARAARFGVVSSQDDSSGAPLTDEQKAAKIEVMKKRAAKFGEVVSSELESVEVAAKKLKRAERFGSPATNGSSELNVTSSADEDSKKAARAARFASEAAATTPKPAATGTVDLEDKKAARAARFATVTAPSVEDNKAKRAERFGTIIPITV